MHDPILRPATNRDGDAVTQLVFSVLAEYGLRPDPSATDADLADIEAHYQAHGGAFDVLEDAGQIIGSVGLHRIDEQTCELRKMYLYRNARGRGLGRRLLDHALQRARALGFKRVTLETASVLTEAIALYTRYGFRPYKPDHPVAAQCDQAYVLELDQ